MRSRCPECGIWMNGKHRGDCTRPVWGDMEINSPTLHRWLNEMISRDELWDTTPISDRPDVLFGMLAADDTHFIDINGGGVVWFTNIHEGVDARAHILIWDKKLSGANIIILQIFLYMMRRFNLHRIWALVPEWHRGVCKAAARAMVFEGVVRQVMRKFNSSEWHNGYLFSVVADDLTQLVKDGYDA